MSCRMWLRRSWQHATGERCGQGRRTGRRHPGRGREPVSQSLRTEKAPIQRGLSRRVGSGSRDIARGSQQENQSKKTASIMKLTVGC